MNAAPVQISGNMSMMGLLVFGLIGLGCLFMLAMILRTFTGRSHRGHQSIEAGSPVSRPRSVLGPVLLGVGLLIAGVVIFGVLTVVSYRVQESAPVTARSESDHARHGPAAIVESASIESSADTTSENSETTDGDSETLPDWTQQKETVLESGVVPTVRFVEISGLYSSKKEAKAEAMKNAISNYRSRLAETWSKLAVQPVPENIFRDASIQKVHIEKRMHSFGAYEEPMYRAYLQYTDSAKAREPVIEAWKSTFSSNRALQFGIGFGALAALLGVVSAGLRALSAAKGSRGRAVMTALAFAGLGLVGLLFVA
ncbi:MAG: hypothetical protein ACI8P0_000185 [Planctomycetaceae bacterium]|jgi:hypothetical protein